VEELCQCYALVQSITKPRQAGGILHIKIPPSPATPEVPGESIYDPKEIKTHVLAQHQTHCSQAEGTIFTQEWLWSLINDTCTNNFSQQVLNGTVAIDKLPINKYTKDLLRHQKSKVSLNQK